MDQVRGCRRGFAHSMLVPQTVLGRVHDLVHAIMAGVSVGSVKTEAVHHTIHVILF